MTLLITIFAAIITTVHWYNKGFENEKKIGTLCLMYWGASIMWFVDAIFEYVELGAEYFTPDYADMINDSFLGLSVVAIGLCIWLCRLLISDPQGIVKTALSKNK